MKKNTLLATIIFCSVLNINAQDIDFEGFDASPSPFVVWRVEGAAEYFDKGSTLAQNVVSGMILKESGTLNLKKKSYLELSWKDQTVILSKKGTYSLKNEAKKLANSGLNTPVLDDFVEEIGAASIFGDTVSSGETIIDSEKNETSEDADWGTRESINIIMPVRGIVLLESVTFSWAGLSGGEGFRINIFKKTNEPAIFSALTENNRFTVDVSQLSIIEEDQYYWQVENVSNPNITSEMASISFLKKNQDLEVIRGIQSFREYAYADPWLKLLREAHALQKENMLYAANEKYKQGLKDFSDNPMIKKMYARFLTKYGLGTIADEILK
jgi:hypothetical protein